MSDEQQEELAPKVEGVEEYNIFVCHTCRDAGIEEEAELEGKNALLKHLTETHGKTEHMGTRRMVSHIDGWKEYSGVNAWEIDGLGFTQHYQYARRIDDMMYLMGLGDGDENDEEPEEESEDDEQETLPD